MITFKSKRETEKEFPHTYVFLNDTYIGYIIKSYDAFGNFPSPYTAIDHNWYFCPELDKNGFITEKKPEYVAPAKTKEILIQEIQRIYAN